MKTFIAILVSVLLLSLYSCTEKDRSAEMVAQLNKTDKFLTDIPEYAGKFANYFWESRKYYDSTLGFPPLDKGFDSIQIRIWYGGSFTGERVISLIHDGKKWWAEISTLSYYENPLYNEDSLNMPSYKHFIPKRLIETKKPQSEFETLIKKLFKLNLLTLPDENKVAGMNIGDVMDGWGVTVEIATKNTYRLYGYSNPDMYFKSIAEARNINQILVLLDKEFSLKEVGNYKDQTSYEVISLDTPHKVKMKEMEIQEIVPEKKRK